MTELYIYLPAVVLGILVLFGAMIGRIETTLGNTFKEHVKCSIHHEAATMFPGRDVRFSLNQLESIYLARIRVTGHFTKQMFWVYCYSVLRDEQKKYDDADFNDSEYLQLPFSQYIN